MSDSDVTTDKTQKKERKRELLVTTALKIFLEKGYANTKIADITTEADMGKGTFYEYFQSKEDILYEILSKKVLNEFILSEKKVNEAPNTREKIKAFLAFQKESIHIYGSNISDLNRELSKWDSKTSKAILEVIHTIARRQHLLIFNIISSAVEKGEFRDVNIQMATAATIGAINSCVSAISAGCIHWPYDVQKTPDNINLWNDDEVVDYILCALKK